MYVNSALRCQKWAELYVPPGGKLVGKSNRYAKGKRTMISRYHLVLLEFYLSLGEVDDSIVLPGREQPYWGVAIVSETSYNLPSSDSHKHKQTGDLHCCCCSPAHNTLARTRVFFLHTMKDV